MEISYVVPTFNSAATLDMTLYSLLSQKNIDVNIIAIDSGSRDGTLDICKRWKIKTLYAKPGNIYRAINIGLRECDTEWLGYINSDDWLYQDSVKRLIACGNASNADIVYGNCDYTDESGRFIYSFGATKASHLPSLFQMGVFGFAQQSAIFRRRVYQQLDGFNENYDLCADVEFYLRAFQADFKFSLLPNLSVSCFRLHGNQLSNKKAKAMEKESQKIFAEARNFTISNWTIFAQWRLRNIPHYLIRFLRQSMLSGKLRITKSMNIYADRD